MQFHGRDGVFMPRKVPLAKGTEGHGSENQEAGLRKCDVGDPEDPEQRRAPAPRSLLSICVYSLGKEDRPCRDPLGAEGPRFFVMRVERVLGALLPVVRSRSIPFLEPLATLQGGAA